MVDRYDALIDSAEHAEAQPAISRRQRAFVGSIGLLHDEIELPYQRPPLSKNYLVGDKPFERILGSSAALSGSKSPPW